MGGGEESHRPGGLEMTGVSTSANREGDHNINDAKIWMSGFVGKR